MGWLPVLLALVASELLYDTGHPVLLTFAIGSTVGCFWSWGTMHNYATEAAKRRSSYRGGFYDITEEEADSVPNWIARVNMCFSALALLAFISALIRVSSGSRYLLSSPCAPYERLCEGCPRVERWRWRKLSRISNRRMLGCASEDDTIKVA